MRKGCAEASCNNPRIKGSHFCVNHQQGRGVSQSLHDAVKELKKSFDSLEAHLERTKGRYP